jgi:hypothetical protein
MLTCFNFDNVISGIRPDRELLWRYNPVNRVNNWIFGGIVPVNELNDRSNI